MAKKTDYEASKGRLADLLKAAPITTPVQEVRPVEEIIEKTKGQGLHQGETHVNFWADTDLIDAVKLHAFTHKTTIKHICIAAIKQYMDQLNRK
ncbi:hypothetical protein [Fibrella forsythiae]|uniref:Uncharacterized protein n=1 Tax=Fibrella forsythiae TaxID=2817061 RepID=A0ABS3JSV8_9BACT|nr:hypothetical protein [Fibrella forsythiae]MBO0953063.1 hypothetical protein [Fibrella forsythiae]